jgi:predicted alpha/beta hydrolase family esterase
MCTYIFIHGGESFKTEKEYIDWLTTTGVKWNIDPYTERENKKKWKQDIAQALTNEWYLVYMPNFPNQTNAKYDEWKIFFDVWIRTIEIQWDIIFIGNSLGGCFLLKYLSEYNSLPWENIIKEIHLIAACINEWDFLAPMNYDPLKILWNRIHIWHAEDDPIVEISVARRIKEYLPNAECHFFESEQSYGHFHGLERFQELKNHLLR